VPQEDLKVKIYSKIDELPTLPTVLPKLLNLMENNKSGASDVADVISNDPALTAKILKISNSAYYGFMQEITSLDKAVPLLGFNMVKSLALSISVMNSLSSSRGGANFSNEGLWIHSLTVATAMTELNKRFGRQNTEEHLFVVGLLHDIGKIVLSLFFGELFEQALKEVVTSKGKRLNVAESEIIGMDHGKIGEMLLVRWKFPEIISAPIGVHHMQDNQDDSTSDDVIILIIANALAQEIGLGQEGNTVPPAIKDRHLQILGAKKKDLEDIKASLKKAEPGILAAFNAMG
jgi:putative nucleotidyltransferase with HDIG domain